MSLTSEPALAKAAPVFAALGDETRLTIVGRLAADGPLSIARLTDGTGVTRQAITKHLEVLAGAGLVHGARHGREHIWTLETGQLSDARRYLELVSQRWDDALDSLRRFVED